MDEAPEDLLQSNGVKKFPVLPLLSATVEGSSYSCIVLIGHQRAYINERTPHEVKTIYTYV